MKPETANVIAIVVFFAAGFVSLNFIGEAVFNILGIAFIIAGVFGIVSMFKTGKFLFEK